MKKCDKTREQLLTELEKSKKRIVELEKSETEHKLVEEKFGLFSSIVEQSTEGMALADLNSKLIYVNKAWCEMHGYVSSKSLLGKNLSIFHNKEQLENDVIPFNKKIKKRGTFSGEVGHITKDGKPFPTLMTSTLVKDPQGNPVAMIGIAKDITEQKRVEEELRNHTLKLSKAQDMANMGFLDWDLKTNKIELSAKTNEIFGLDPDDKWITSELVAKVVHPDDLELVQSRLEQAINGKKDYNIDHRIIRPDGKVIWTHSQAELIKDHDDNPISLLGTMIDITQRKQTEKRLSEKTTLLDNVINRASNIAIVTTDLDLHITSYNPVAEKFFGYKAKEVLGKTINEMHLKEKVEPERLEKAFETVKATGEYNYFVTQETEKGRRILMSRVTGMLNTSGEIVGYVLFSSDITELKMTEEEITKLSKIAETTSQFIVMTTVDGNVTYVNQAYLDESGYTRQEVIGFSMFNFSTDKGNKILKEETIPALLTKGDWQGEMTVTRKDNSIFQAELICSLIKSDLNEPQHFVAVFTDITERKQTEKKLRESEERFRRFFTDLGDAVFVTKVGGKNRGLILEVNPAAEKQTGYTYKELIGKNIEKDLAIPESRDISEIDWDKKLLNGETVTNAEKKRRKDGTEYWVEVIVTPINYMGKKACLSINRDITLRKMAEESIKRQHEELLSMFNGMDEVVYVADPNTHELLFFNKKAQEIWGNCIGKKCYKALQNRNKSCPFCSNKEIFGDNLGKSHTWEFRNEIDKRWYRCIDRAINWPGKGMVRYEMAIDITEYKQAEKKLRKSEEKLRNIFENSTNLFYSHTPDHILTYLSPQIEEILGYTVEEALINWTELASDNPINEEGFKNTVAAIETGKRQEPYELELLHKNGKKVLLEIREAPVVENGKTIAIVGAATDITKRKHSEVELKEKMDQLERFNKLAVGRELRMVELKREINELLEKAGKDKIYDSPE